MDLNDLLVAECVATQLSQAYRETGFEWLNGATGVN